MYNDVDSQDDSSCASDKRWDMKKDGGQDDNKNFVYDDDIEQDEINDLNKDLLHLRNGLGDNINNANNELQYIEEGGILNEDEGQGDHFGNAKNIPLANHIQLAQNEHFGGANNNDDDDDDNNNNNDNENQYHGRNNHNQVSEDNTVGNESYNDYDNYDGDSEDNHEDDRYPEDEEHEDDNVDEPRDNGQDANDIDQLEDDTGPVRRRNRRCIHQSLPSTNGRDELEGPHWRVLNSHICPILGAIIVAEQAGV